VGVACGANRPPSPVGGGRGEGALNLVAPSGWVEDGSNDPAVDWVHPFQARTGCQVTVRFTDVHGEVVALLRSQRGRQFDGALVPGDVAGVLVARGDVAPLDPAAIPDWGGVVPALRDRDVVAGRHFGAPAGYGPNLLLYEASAIRPAPDSWGPTWQANSDLRGRLTAADSPMELADAAVYLMAHEPALAITDPFELTPAQFDAAVQLVRARASLVASYWSSSSDQILAFESGQVEAGDGTGLALDVLQRRPENTVAGVIPSEGATGWIASWMASAHARHPACMAAWIRWTMTPAVQAQMAGWNVAAPANAQACPLLRRSVGAAADQDAFGRCGDPNLLESVHLWSTPQDDCGEGRTGCVPYDQWVSRWMAIRDAAQSPA
jgi:putative spermidine/putrescine transport system substrate-binding protein